MWIALTILSAILVLALLYLFCLLGRRGHRLLPELRKWRYAHRGLHNESRPENSMAAFRAALEHGYGIELDIHLMADGNLAVIHDGNLKRVAGADVCIEDLTAGDLPNYRLMDTEETIPLFGDVLALFAGKAPMVVELKCERGNHAALCAKALELLDAYEGPYCVESFDPRAVHWLKKHRPDICRGQLSENWFRSQSNMPWILKLAMTYHISNVFTRPDFIAYKYRDRKAAGTDLCRKTLGIQGVSWTLQSQQELEIAEKEGWIPIFEHFAP